MPGISFRHQRDIEHLIALYDGEINYWDYHLGLDVEVLTIKVCWTTALSSSPVIMDKCLVNTANGYIVIPCTKKWCGFP